MDLKSLTIEELKNEIGRLGEPKFRAAQIYDLMHKKGAAEIDEMSNISLALREKLKDIPEKMGRCVTMEEADAAALYTLLYKLLDTME